MSRSRRFQLWNVAKARRSRAQNRAIVSPLWTWRSMRSRQRAWSSRLGVRGTGWAPEKGWHCPLRRLPHPARMVISDAYGSACSAPLAVRQSPVQRVVSILVVMDQRARPDDEAREARIAELFQSLL